MILWLQFLLESSKRPLLSHRVSGDIGGPAEYLHSLLNTYIHQGTPVKSALKIVETAGLHPTQSYSKDVMEILLRASVYVWEW